MRTVSYSDTKLSLRNEWWAYNHRSKIWGSPGTLLTQNVTMDQVSVTTRRVSYSDPTLSQRNDCGVFKAAPHISTMKGTTVTFVIHNEPCIRRDHQRVPDVNVTCRIKTDQRQLTVRYRQSTYEQAPLVVVSQPPDTAHHPINVTITTSNAQRTATWVYNETRPVEYASQR